MVWKDPIDMYHKATVFAISKDFNGFRGGHLTMLRDGKEFFKLYRSFVQWAEMLDIGE